MIPRDNSSSITSDVVENERPFYFVVVFWGETFRNYLVDYCLASLLSPENIPSLGVGQHKFLFCTTRHDWEQLSASKTFVTIKQFVDPLFIEISLPPDGKSGCEHMGIGHKSAAEIIHKRQAYGIFLTPDMMVSDGTVSFLRRQARLGTQLVLVAALRFGEEPLFENLRSIGILEHKNNELQNQKTLSITGRHLASICIKSFHSEALRCEWDAPYFTSFPSACWWKVKGENGIVIHSLSWAPLLVDYSQIEKHDTQTLENWTIDGDYIYKNFGVGSKIHVVRDSDEIMIVSWAPMADRAQSLFPNPLKMLPFIGNLLKGSTLRAALLSGVFDPLKLKIFFLSVRWHAEGIGSAWSETELRASKVLRSFAWDADVSSVQGISKVWKVLVVLLSILGRISIVATHLCQYRSRFTQRFFQALHGDKGAWIRIFQRIAYLLRWLIAGKAKPN